jgi:hypothetical protein
MANLWLRIDSSQPVAVSSPRFARGVWLVGVAVLLLAYGGCSRMPPDRPQTAPVRGRVMYQGEPVPGARVAFVREGAPRVAAGTTDQDGNFQLTTFEPNDGAVLGDQVATVRKMKVQTTPVTGPLDGEAYQKALAEAEAAARAGSAVPPRYADPATSNLKVVVTSGTNVINLDLID